MAFRINQSNKYANSYLDTSGRRTKKEGITDYLSFDVNDPDASIQAPPQRQRVSKTGLSIHQMSSSRADFF